VEKSTSLPELVTTIISFIISMVESSKPTQLAKFALYPTILEKQHISSTMDPSYLIESSLADKLAKTDELASRNHPTPSTYTASLTTKPPV